MPITKNNITVVIFSKDRPLQLDLTLTSYEKNSIQRYDNEIVIYKTSSERFEKAYNQISKEHPNIRFLKETDFKLNLLDCLKNKRYVLFLVDDCIFTKKFSIKNICNFLDMCQGAIGFSLRLGENTTYCYSLSVDNGIPAMQPLGSNIYGFNWKEAGPGDFSYPLEVSSSVYRVEDIKGLLENLPYNNPNSLEWLMSINVKFFNHLGFLLSFRKSVAFCDPINRVQTDNNNRAGVNPRYSIENLLILYEAGYRIDHNLFDGFVSNACHQEVDIDFLEPNKGTYEYR